DPRELRGAASRPRARPAECLPDRRQRPSVTRDRLRLDLGEPTRGPRAVQDRDRVEHDLDALSVARDAVSLPPRAELCYRFERRVAAQEGGEQIEQSGRDSSRAACLLELQAAVE